MKAQMIERCPAHSTVAHFGTSRSHPPLRSSWPHDEVCRARCAGGDRNRPLHTTPPARCGSALPQRRRGGGTSRQSHPRGARQLPHPHPREGPSLAVAPPVLSVPLHPDLGRVAQRRRRFLLGDVTSAAATRNVHRDRRPASGDQALHRRAQQAAKALRLDQAGRRNPQQPGCTVRLRQCIR